ncbi:DUF2530 domain-containing protein [Microtetraspora malaysiensis]|uniref:DUF2530 domain-containing protein n=1 Tax=Microtetraspora malaysiensis TaxID=161358 RepID=A0ABW6SLT6_9ACTN
MSQQPRPDLQPIRTNDTATILIGTALWLVALVVLLIVRPEETRWLWTCAAGFGLGLFGLAYIRRRDRLDRP